jgi:cyclopropane-fatty-acyl-phospholipid synthase
MYLQKRLGDAIAGMRAKVTLPLRLVLWDDRHIDFSSEVPTVTLRLPHARAAHLLFTPSLSNLGRAYVEGDIEVEGRASDMIAIVHALAQALLKPDGKFARIVRALEHDRASDAAAIRYHYDVSDAFYAQILDRNMVYSCAYFEDGDEDLDAAQVKKLDHVLAKLRVEPGHSLLDIGCGWGALLLHAARRHGVRGLGITLSDNQCRYARERVAQAGLAHLVEIRLQDYREVRGSFDRIASIGMSEHVGRDKLPAYFAAIGALLAPDGVALNHGITSTDTAGGETPYGGGEFIARYVFPNGELNHIGQVLQAMQENGLEAHDVENMRRHYARTCAIWSDNAEAHAQQLRQLGGDKTFRIWKVYLAGCGYAFEHDLISVFQVVCGKTGRGASVMPWSRRYQYGATAGAPAASL